MNEDAAVFQYDFLGILIGHEVGRKITSVKLHSFDQFDFGRDIAAFFNRNHTIFADFQQCVGKDLTNRRIIVAGDGSNAGDLFSIVRFDTLGHPSKFLNNRSDSLLSTSAECHGVSPGRDVLQPGFVDGMGQQGGCRGAVARNVVGFRRGFLDQLNPDVLVGIFQLNVFCNRDTVFGDFRCAPPLVQHSVPTARPECAADCSCKL